MKKQKNFKQRGITLVALVITIIILLILAGITISQLTGSGLFENARLAEQKSKEAQEKENQILSEYESWINGGYRDNKDYDTEIHDEWTTWLHLAGIDNPKQYDRAKIVENKDLMNKLLNDNEALEYMIQSTDFILPAICISETAIDYVAQNENARIKILMDSNWRNVLEKMGYMSKFDELAIKVPTLTTINDNVIYSSLYTGGAGHEIINAFDGKFQTSGWGSGVWITESLDEDGYIGYKFNEPVLLYKFSLSSTIYKKTTGGLTYSFVLQGLNEDGTWENIGDEYLNDYTATGVYKNDDYYINTNKKYYGYRLRNNYSTSGNGEKYWHVYGETAIGIGELQFYCVR